MTFWHKARYLVLLILIFLITISSHPTIAAMSRDAGIESGTILSRYIILVFVVLFLMCINVKSMLGPKMVRVGLLLWVWIFLYYLITFSFFNKSIMMSDVRSIAICLVSIMIGWQMNLDVKRFRAMLLVFSVLTLFVGLMQVFTNIGGFIIRDQYFTDKKNSLGVMLSTSLIVFLLLWYNRQEKGFLKVSLLVLCLLSFVVLLTIRARAATITSVIVFLFIMYSRFRGRDFWLYLILGLFLIFIVFLVLPSEFKQYVYNSIFQNYEEGDITAGRAWRNAAALRFLSSHLWLGNLNSDVNIAQIHNYPLNRTYEFGIAFALPILLVYLYYMIKTVVKTTKADSKNFDNVGYYLLLIPFIISMVEPTFPFGPGTATVFNFMVFGLTLRYASDAKKQLVNS